MKNPKRKISESFEREIERGEMLADDFGTPLRHGTETDLQPAVWLNRPEVRDA